jgi:hypothetical protein
MTMMNDHLKAEDNHRLKLAAPAIYLQRPAACPER